MSGRTDSAASFDDRAEPGQAKPAGGVAEEVPHDGRASATPPTSAAQDRESRDFFYVHDDGRVSKIVGYICEGTPGYWWCPEVGVSAAEGYHLFRDRVLAYDKAHEQARHALDVAQANLTRIEEERWA